MAPFFIIFIHELQISFRHIGKILSNFLFFLISVAIFTIISQNQDIQGSTTFYSITIIWFSLLSCLIFSAAEFLKKDFDDGTIEQILTSVDNFEIFILAKMLGNWLVCCLPILISIFPLGAVIGLNHDLIVKLFWLVFLASLAINFISTFCGSLSTLGNSAPMIAVIALPLIIPVILLAYSGLIEGQQEDFKILDFKIMGGFCIFIGCITVLATSKIVKIAAE
jgi:heme exporter protein CcmB